MYIFSVAEKNKLIQKNKGKSLSELFPAVAKDWCYEKNGDLTPEMVPSGSHNKVWWECKNHHQYYRDIHGRTSGGTGCPYCSGRLPIISETDIATTHPYILEEWNYERNKSITPQMVSMGSEKKVWWRCELGHEYFASVGDKIRKNQKCPYCSGKKVLIGFNDLETTDPDIAKEWCYDKNKNLSPKDISRGVGNKVWWICPNEHEYQAAVYHRTQGGTGCPYCNGKKVFPGYNDLLSARPDIAKEWDYEKNGNLKPADVTKTSSNKVWWICPEGHSYKCTIGNRFYGKGCPYCVGKQVLIGFNDIVTTDPEVAREWHPTKNGDLKATDFTRGSIKKVWWICPNGHDYSAVIEHRTLGGNGCPQCSGSKLEQLLYKILEENQILYVAEKRFNDEQVKNFPFDIYCENHNVIIEADGSQHFRESNNGFFDRKMSMVERVNHDDIKNTFCVEHKIPILRIPYSYNPVSQKKKIEKIVLEFISSKKIPQEIVDFYINKSLSNYEKITHIINSW